MSISSARCPGPRSIVPADIREHVLIRRGRGPRGGDCSGCGAGLKVRADLVKHGGSYQAGNFVDVQVQIIGPCRMDSHSVSGGRRNNRVVDIALSWGASRSRILGNSEKPIATKRVGDGGRTKRVSCIRAHADYH
jgi:hypothetical protein